MEVTKLVEAFDGKGRLRRLREHAGRNASERRAGLETGNAEADPPEIRGRPPSLGEASDRALSGSAGVVATACLHKEIDRNTGSPSGGGA